MLNDFFEIDELSKKRYLLVTSINDLVEKFRLKNAPVIWVRQEFEPDLSDAFLAMKKTGRRVTIKGTRGCEILDDLIVDKTDKVIVKKRYSAFLNTELDGYLKEKNIEQLVFSGINTHACVRASLIDAYQLDYHTILAVDCTASYDDEHHNITLKYLKRAVCEVLKNVELEQSIFKRI